MAPQVWQVASPLIMGMAQVVPGAEQRPLAAWPPPVPRQQGLLRPPQAVWPVPHEPSALQLSLREPQDNAASGWWTALTEPAQLTVRNYRNLLDNAGIIDAFFNTIFITVPATLLVVLIASAAGYAFAWLDFPGRDWLFLLVVPAMLFNIRRFRQEQR